MSSKKYATPLRLEVKPSQILLYFLLVIHLIALLITYLLKFNLLLSGFISTLIILSAYFVISKYAILNSSKAIVKLIWDANDEWIIETKSGNTVQAKLKQDSYIHPFITILIFNRILEAEQRNPSSISGLQNLHPNYRYNVILLKDNIAANDFRRLRVRLKVGKPIETGLS